jgi:hypothetical protein
MLPKEFVGSTKMSPKGRKFARSGHTALFREMRGAAQMFAIQENNESRAQEKKLLIAMDVA